jgi:tRNA(fMet)-specific endonuclease VapC
VKFLLDTDTVSFALRGEGRVAEHLRTHRSTELGVSAITVAELRYGADLRRSNRLHRLIDAFTMGVRTLPFDDRAALRFGVLAASMQRQGQGIGDFDCLIAAHALAEGMTLVTHNHAHFGRIRGLKLEDWYG